MFDTRQTKEEIAEGGMKLHAQLVEALAEIERLRKALKPFAHHAHVAEALEQSALAPIVPHDYFPSAMHMGDCAVCGHVRDAEIHKQPATKPAASRRGQCVDGEPNTCTQPVNWDDGVPYCDTCGLYRQKAALDAVTRRKGE